VQPLFDLATDESGARYVRFLAALYRAGGEWLAVVDDAFAPQWALIAPVLARATPDLAKRRRARRLALAGETMVRMLADPHRYAGDLDPGAYRDDVVDVFTAIVTGPTPSQETP